MSIIKETHLVVGIFEAIWKGTEWEVFVDSPEEGTIWFNPFPAMSSEEAILQLENLNRIHTEALLKSE